MGTAKINTKNHRRKIMAQIVDSSRQSKGSRGIRLDGKVAVITGAASGIGKATADLFLREGAKVVAADLNYDGVEALKSEFHEYADNIVPFKVNVSDKDQVESMIDCAVESFGTLDILYNNAGIMDNMSMITDVDDGLYERVMRINVDSVFFGTRKAVQYFLEQNKGGVILNTASVGGLGGGKAGFAYTASKHAVVGMTKSVAFSYGEYGIRCNAICPGGIATNIGASMKNVSVHGYEQTNRGMALMQRTGDPYEIAFTAAFLCSDDASFINGVTVTVDGGWTAY